MQPIAQDIFYTPLDAALETLPGHANTCIYHIAVKGAVVLIKQLTNHDRRVFPR